MNKYKHLGTAKLLWDAPFSGKKGDVVIVVACPEEVYGPAQDDGSDATGDFWAIPSATNLTVACIGKPGCDFEWVTEDACGDGEKGEASQENMSLTLDQIQEALRKARPSTEPGTYAPHRREAVKAMYVGWRYTVLKVADELDSRYFEFDRKAFNKACEVL